MQRTIETYTSITAHSPVISLYNNFHSNYKGSGRLILKVRQAVVGYVRLLQATLNYHMLDILGRFKHKGEVNLR